MVACRLNPLGYAGFKPKPQEDCTVASQDLIAEGEQGGNYTESCLG